MGPVNWMLTVVESNATAYEALRSNSIKLRIPRYTGHVGNRDNLYGSVHILCQQREGGRFAYVDVTVNLTSRPR